MPSPREIALALYPASARRSLAEAMKDYPADDPAWIEITDWAYKILYFDSELNKYITPINQYPKKFIHMLRGASEKTRNEAIMEIASSLDRTIDSRTSNFMRTAENAKQAYKNIKHFDGYGSRQRLLEYIENNHEAYLLIVGACIVFLDLFVCYAAFVIGKAGA